MKLNPFECRIVNNPVRALIQEYIETREMRKHSSLPEGGRVLEVGCGNGTGTRLIKKYFKPEEIEAVDLDLRMIEIAVRNNKDPETRFRVADASKLPYPDNSFDAVFDYGIIHHIPNWRDCLRELHRVTKPGGTLILEDLSKETFQTRFGRHFRKYVDHPYEEMHTQEDFREQLQKLGLKITYEKIHHPLYTLRYFIIIARK
jgi:ubiquinone/menaquinone biosynthesis C-methylase UbiE